MLSCCVGLTSVEQCSRPSWASLSWFFKYLHDETANAFWERDSPSEAVGNNVNLLGCEFELAKILSDSVQA